MVMMADATVPTFHTARCDYLIDNVLKLVGTSALPRPRGMVRGKMDHSSAMWEDCTGAINCAHMGMVGRKTDRMIRVEKNTNLP